VRACEIARLFHRWPHEVAGLPLTYFHELNRYYELINTPAEEKEEESSFEEISAAAAEWQEEMVVETR